MKKHLTDTLGYAIIIGIFGLTMFVLGFFDLTETRFGYQSSTTMAGFIVILYAWFNYRIGQLESAENADYVNKGVRDES